METNSQATSRGATSIIAVIILVVIIGAGGFVGGMQYQKSKAGTTTASSQMAGQNGGFGGQTGRSMNGSFGTVAAVSASSISVQDRRSSSAKIYSISSSTTISDNGTTKAASDIAVGDNVMVRTSSSTSTAATTINLNPSFGGGPGGSAPTSTSTDGSST